MAISKIDCGQAHDGRLRNFSRYNGVRKSPGYLRILLTFIGPAIGYYCLDLFPMNSYEFYQFLAIACNNYLLLITMF